MVDDEQVHPDDAFDIYADIERRRRLTEARLAQERAEREGQEQEGEKK